MCEILKTYIILLDCCSSLAFSALLTNLVLGVAVPINLTQNDNFQLFKAESEVSYHNLDIYHKKCQLQKIMKESSLRWILLRNLIIWRGYWARF